MLAPRTTDKRVDICVLIPGTQGLQGKSYGENGKTRGRRPRPQALRKELEGRAEEEQMVKRQVRREEGVSGGGQKPAEEGRGVAAGERVRVVRRESANLD